MSKREPRPLNEVVNINGSKVFAENGEAWLTNAIMEQASDKGDAGEDGEAGDEKKVRQHNRLDGVCPIGNWLVL